MRLHASYLVLAFVVMCAYAGCSDAGCSDDADDAAGTTGVGGSGGGLPTCTGVLEVTGEPGNLHGTHCIGCLEEKCCGALAACAADTACLACVEDITPPACDANAAVLDLAQCAIDQCEYDACNCISCHCEDDGVCDLPGMERCDCADCATFEGCHAGCDNNGECDGSDSCACPDCFDACMGCNGDGFCDLYNEPCDCSDCAGNVDCDSGAGGHAGAGGGGP